jgi:hypothetical protein
MRELSELEKYRMTEQGNERRVNKRTRTIQNDTTKECENEQIREIQNDRKRE